MRSLREAFNSLLVLIFLYTFPWLLVGYQFESHTVEWGACKVLVLSRSKSEKARCFDEIVIAGVWAKPSINQMLLEVRHIRFTDNGDQSIPNKGDEVPALGLIR